MRYLIVFQLLDLEAGAADLEGAGHLQVLRFQVDETVLIDIGRADQVRMPDHTFQRV